MKILVADGNDASRAQLCQFLESDGHRAVGVGEADGVMNSFVRESPDMVLIDCNLGPEDLSQQIKLRSHQRFVPVVYMTPMADEAALGKFVEGGADDFIENPANRLALRAKIMGIERTFRLYNDLESFKVKAEQEIKLARHMFDAVTRRRSQDLGELSSWVWAAGHFSGDMLIYEKNISGRLYIMLGDFTGHGLAAAVGVIPASDAFFSLAERGAEVAEIAAEINRKLYNMLPTGHFCAACIAEVDFDQALLHVWNGGLPPPMMAVDEGKAVARMKSQNLPLGILSPADFSPKVETLAPSSRTSVVFYSDGLVESVNAHGEMFGEERLEVALGRYSGSSTLLNTIKKKVIAFMDGLDPVDDITLLTLRLE